LIKIIYQEFHMKRFTDKTAVITGAGNGIGLSIAHAFAEEGAHVIVAEINSESGRRAEAEIAERGGKVSFVQVDVSDEAGVENMVKSVVSITGCIDILVNNAGVVLHKSLFEMKRNEWDRQMEVQLTGPFLTIKHVGKQMVKAGKGGRIVNISSVSAVMGRVKGGAHCTAKAGLTLLTKVAAMELAEHGINVNAVAPGLIDVPAQRSEDNLAKAYIDRYMKEVPLKRMGLPSDIASTVLFLSSDEAAWITGQLQLVDGGLMAGHYTFQGTHDFSMLEGH
jgi:NAD(P)-dependent dehydrogenase (short-subunit alcohol dehydrogenase family)